MSTTESTLPSQDYRNSLRTLANEMKAVPNSSFSKFSKILCLIELNMRYEKEIAFNKHLTKHPFELLEEMVEQTRFHFHSLMSCSFLEDASLEASPSFTQDLEEKHHLLWQEIWPRHTDSEFDDFVRLKRKRFQINELGPLVQNARCAEFGCGNGAILCALLEMGAQSVSGIDWGEKSVKYATNKVNEYSGERPYLLRVANVLDSQFQDEEFDFAVSNGVFHHLHPEDIVPALKEVHRTLKPGSYFWFYTEGNSLATEVWRVSVEILEEVSPVEIERVLKLLNVSRPKTAHIMDGLKATYLCATLEEVKNWLHASGFEFIRRMEGGEPFDQDTAEETDPYHQEKFRDGDIRILARKI